MPYSMTRIDAHQNGDCDAATCPLCELEDVSVCDACEEAIYADLETCEHGWSRCDDCGLCPDCKTEARRP